MFGVQINIFRSFFPWICDELCRWDRVTNSYAAFTLYTVFFIHCLTNNLNTKDCG